MGYTFKGSYKLLKDTLLVTLKDDSHSEDNGKVKFIRDKYLIRGDKLYCIGSGELINGKWLDRTNISTENTYSRVK